MSAEPRIYATTASPIGELLLVGDGEALRGLYMQEGRVPKRIRPGWRRDDAALAGVVAQLGEYFAGHRREFDVPVAFDGPPFQVQAWQALRDIPYGETVSYGEQARRIGHPDAARAVGAANGQNPIAVIVPCHRVIGSDGSLTGFGGGLARKRLLLDLESDTASGTLRLEV